MNPTNSLHKGKGINLLNQRLKEKRVNSPTKRAFSPVVAAANSPTTITTTTTTNATTMITTTTAATTTTTTVATTNEDLLSNEILSGLDLAIIQQKIDLSSNNKQKQRTASTIPMEAQIQPTTTHQGEQMVKSPTNKMDRPQTNEQNYVAVRTIQKLNQLAQQKHQVNIILLCMHTILWFLFFSLSIILVTGIAVVLILIAQKGVL